MKKNRILWAICLLVLAALLLAVVIVLLPNNREGQTLPQTDSETTQNSNQPENSAPSTDMTEPSTATEQPTSEPKETTDASEPITDELVEPTAPSETPFVTEEGDDLQELIDELLNEIYGLRDYYTAQLSYLEASARAEYEALSHENRNAENKQRIALRCVEQAYALETECDARMNEISGELGRLLLKQNGDLNLISEVQYAYAREKQTAKTQFMDRYADYFG